MGIWSGLMYKIFKLEPDACQVCEVLREQLYKSEAERKELLTRALAPSVLPVEPIVVEEPHAIKPQYTPWRVRQQMLEQEDRKQAELMREKKKEIENLEKELNIPLMESR